MNNNLIYDMIRLDNDNILMNNCITHIYKDSPYKISVCKNGVVLFNINLINNTIQYLDNSIEHEFTEWKKILQLILWHQYIYITINKIKEVLNIPLFFLCSCNGL